MLKLNDRKLSVITAIILVFIICGIVAVCSIPGETVVINGGKGYAPIYNGDRSKNGVALSFNVYEGTEIVEGILDVLDEKNSKATFFIGGCWADDNIDTIKKILEKGHEIGSHGYFHKDHKKLDYEGNKQEIYITELIVKSLCGEKTTLFAPPSGSFSDVTLDAASDLGYKVIMWSKDTIDWRDKDSSLVYKRATGNPASGDLILMHPKPHTLSALPQIIDFYLINGFTFCTVGENVT